MFKKVVALVALLQFVSANQEIITRNRSQIAPKEHHPRFKPKPENV